MPIKKFFKNLIYAILTITFISSCDSGKNDVIADLPRILSEVSGLEKIPGSNLLWMINDSGNAPILYGLDTLGIIKKQLKIDVKNRDWEDLASDKNGNIYIGDFGNNANNRKDLKILKIAKSTLLFNNILDIDEITFYYPEQNAFPPKTNEMHFDCEAFIHFKDSLYLFTKSRTKTAFGKTNLYKIPAKKGHHKAEFISSFNTCDDRGCWITSADINEKEDKIALLTEHSVWVFSNFSSTDFFNGNVNNHKLEYHSQKESILFKNDSTLLITDERSVGKGGKLYQFYLNN